MKEHALQKLQEISSKAKDTAAKVLASEQATESQLIAQRDQLKEYRDDYSRQLESAQREGVDIATIRSYSAFLSSLDKAYRTAIEQAVSQKQRVGQSRETWVGAHKRSASFDALKKRQHQRETKMQAKREAKALDEFNTNAAARQSLRANH